MEDWWKIFRKQHFERQAAQNQHTSLVVQANCLFARDEDPLHGAPDYVYYAVRFKAIAEMFCSQLGILPSQGTVSLDSSEIELSKQTGEPVDFVIVPARDPQTVTKRPA
jgi:hypothetical protein